MIVSVPKITSNTQLQIGHTAHEGNIFDYSKTHVFSSSFFLQTWNEEDNTFWICSVQLLMTIWPTYYIESVPRSETVWFSKIDDVLLGPKIVKFKILSINALVIFFNVVCNISELHSKVSFSFLVEAKFSVALDLI